MFIPQVLQRFAFMWTWLELYLLPTPPSAPSLTSALKKMSKTLMPVLMRSWRSNRIKTGIKGDRGFIAQEFEQVFPDLIDTWKDPAPEGEAPYKSVRQDLIPVLVKAMQEQQAMINELKAKVAVLESK